jgi:hypothetical protein
MRIKYTLLNVQNQKPQEGGGDRAKEKHMGLGKPRTSRAKV